MGGVLGDWEDECSANAKDEESIRKMAIPHNRPTNHEELCMFMMLAARRYIT